MTASSGAVFGRWSFPICRKSVQPVELRNNGEKHLIYVHYSVKGFLGIECSNVSVHWIMIRKEFSLSVKPK